MQMGSTLCSICTTCYATKGLPSDGVLEQSQCTHNSGVWVLPHCSAVDISIIMSPLMLTILCTQGIKTVYCYFQDFTKIAFNY